MKIFDNDTYLTVIMECKGIVMNMCCPEIGREKIEKKKEMYETLLKSFHTSLLFYGSIAYFWFFSKAMSTDIHGYGNDDNDEVAVTDTLMCMRFESFFTNVIYG